MLSSRVGAPFIAHIIVVTATNAEGLDAIPGRCELSLDPAHPSAIGHRYIVNDLIDVVNAKYGTSVAKVAIP